MAKNIVTREKDYSQWYLDVIKAAELADYSPVRGCMVIRPGGFAIWESIQRDLDFRFKETGHVNAYFPLLIPVSFLQKEAQHIEGFAMECAVVTHSGLEAGENGLVPKGKISEPLIIRPTSETIIGHMYSQWIKSYRDLPVLINQWANVMRWEMRTRLFLRTAEFLWQEGHTAHETAEECEAETLRMLDVYSSFAREMLALPVVKGRKTDSEKFAGADTTYTIEVLMQDNKAVQAGTSHNLGQNFAKALDIKFQGRDQNTHFVYTTSWGVSTRLIGALIMAHSDDEGLVLPPRIAPTLAAVVPIYKTPEEKTKVLAYARKLIATLCGETRTARAEELEKGRDFLNVFFDDKLTQKITLDVRDDRPGEKHFYWEQRGVPFRLEIGPRDVDAGNFVLKTRFDNSKTICSVQELSADWFKTKAEHVQQEMLTRAESKQNDATVTVNSYTELKEFLAGKGGFARAWFAPDKAAEAKIKEETKGTVRCIPLEQPGGTGKCIFSGKETSTQVLFAQSY